jgi:maleylacetoacetate isomerase
MRMFGFWRSAAAHRVRIGLNLKGLAYDETMIDLDSGQQASDAYREVNPGAVVPTLIEDDGASFHQSLAILEYLDETRPEPPLLPADPKGRARVRALALVWAADSHPFITPRVRSYLAEHFGVDEGGRTEWIRHWLSRGLEIAEARLSADTETARFCHGDQVTIADICLAVQAGSAKHFGVEMERFPTIGRIWRNCLEIEAFAAAQPLRQPGAPKPA